MVHYTNDHKSSFLNYLSLNNLHLHWVSLGDMPFSSDSREYSKLLGLLSILGDDLSFLLNYLLSFWGFASPIRKWFGVRVSKSLTSSQIAVSGCWLIMHSVSQMKVYTTSLVNTLSRVVALWMHVWLILLGTPNHPLSTD